MSISQTEILAIMAYLSDGIHFVNYANNNRQDEQNAQDLENAITHLEKARDGLSKLVEMAGETEQK